MDKEPDFRRVVQPLKELISGEDPPSLPKIIMGISASLKIIVEQTSDELAEQDTRRFRNDTGLHIGVKVVRSDPNWVRYGIEFVQRGVRKVGWVPNSRFGPQDEFFFAVNGGLWRATSEDTFTDGGDAYRWEDIVYVDKGTHSQEFRESGLRPENLRRLKFKPSTYGGVTCMNTRDYVADIYLLNMIARGQVRFDTSAHPKIFLLPEAFFSPLPKGLLNTPQE